MKKIEIITRTEKVEIIKEVLAKHEYSGLTVTACMGCGHQKGTIKEFEALNLDLNLVPKVHVMTVVWDEDLEDVLCDLQANLTTGSVGDGKIFISTVEDVVRIRTGERGYKTL